MAQLFVNREHMSASVNDGLSRKGKTKGRVLTITQSLFGFKVTAAWSDLKVAGSLRWVNGVRAAAGLRDGCFSLKSMVLPPPILGHTTMKARFCHQMVQNFFSALIHQN